MKKLVKLLLAMAIASSSAFFVSVEKAETVEAAVCPIGQFPQLTGDNPVTFQCKDPVIAGADNSKTKVQKVQAYFLFFLKMLTGISTAIAVLVIVMSGFMYVTSEGNSRKLEEAKTWLVRAGVGLLVVSSAFIILSLVSNISGLSM